MAGELGDDRGVRIGDQVLEDGGVLLRLVLRVEREPGRFERDVGGGLGARGGVAGGRHQAYCPSAHQEPRR